MALSIPLVWTEAHRLHEPGGEVWIGMPIPGDEVPERADAIRAELEEAGARVVEAEPHDDSALLAVHDPGLLEFLRTAWDRWQAAGYPQDHGQDRVVGYIFPTAGLLGGLPPAVPASPSALTGSWAFDTMTPLGPGTWEAARAAVDCALTACDLVLAGAPAAYACTRPPGHHVTRSAYGGSCYLNNAAIAAQRLREAGIERVAIVDVDAHHGNGAQEIFWRRDDVLTCSVHVDPAAGWFPHFLGFEHERATASRNVTLAPGAGDAEWLPGLDLLLGSVRDHEAGALVVALGVDAAAADPESPLRVSADGFRDGGRALGRLGLPTVVVQEGGYDLAMLGGLVRAALEGFEVGLEDARA
jgi:acetoin utilization deacetylase AcuC-like enzyme